MRDERLAPQKDTQTVDSNWQSVKPRIRGVEIKHLPTISDDRGTLCEVFRPAWAIHPDPLVYVYQVTIRPGQIKGWVKHLDQDDRIFVSMGTCQVVLFDDRDDSPTRGMVNELFFSHLNRALFTIPAGVWHALRAVGSEDVMFINMPTRPYDYTNPDKFRLPLENDLIPFRFK
jgi:dTDP-4-dehydrorhamnose 3,5-epimerase